MMRAEHVMLAQHQYKHGRMVDATKLILIRFGSLLRTVPITNKIEATTTLGHSNAIIHAALLWKEIWSR